jgi:predicted amidohydrolase
MMRTIRIAAAQYPIEWLPTFEAWRAKFTRWVSEAAGQGAQLLVFPEYASMELPAIFGQAIAANLQQSLEMMNSMFADVECAHVEAAVRFGVHILAPTFPVLSLDKRYRNVARLFTPEGCVGAQAKLIMTRSEREVWDIAPGDTAYVFNTALGCIGVSICYDVEFPLIARAQVAAGAEIILTPSCTDTYSGYWRVRFGAQARALENQCFVVQAPTVGMAPWSSAIDENYGCAGVYAPPDAGFVADGIVALGEMNRAQWVYADLDLEQLAKIREAGEVLNYQDWDRQNGGKIHAAKAIDLID